MLKYVEKPLQRAKHLIAVALTFQIYCSNDFFLVKMINNAKPTSQKSKLIILKNARNWASIKLDI